MRRKILWVSLALFALAMLFPVWVAVTGAISSDWELTENLGPILGGSTVFARWDILPRSPSFRSLVRVLLDSPGFFTMFWNSVVISLGTLAGQLLFAAPAAWALAKLRLPGGKRLEASTWC